MWNPFKANNKSPAPASQPENSPLVTVDAAPPAPVKQDAAVLPPEVAPLTQVLDDVQAYYRNAQMQRSAGTVMNPLSGAGGYGDKSMFFQFLPFWLDSKSFIENTLINSWVASRFINMPVDDMFTKPREYEDEKFLAYADMIQYNVKIARAMRLARKYGTGLMWMVTKEASPEEPLEIDRIRPGDLTNIVTLDRYDANVLFYDRDIHSVRMGQPEMYQLHVNSVGTFNVHASRIYRFDGITSDSSNGWNFYNRDWGVSNLAHAMTEILNDASVMQAVSHLVQEASIPVQKINGLMEILCQEDTFSDEMSVQQRMAQINALKSIYRTVFMDSKDEFTREAVNFASIPDLIEKFSDRLAMMAGISATRFLNKSPDGQNSTGEGDMRNDNRTTAARQELLLDPCYVWADQILARAAGTAVPDYNFPPLFELSQKEEAELIGKRAEASVKMVQTSCWTEDDARHYVATGNLPEGSIDPMTLEEEEEAATIVNPEEEQAKEEA